MVGQAWTHEDELRYVELVGKIRRARGLQPGVILWVGDPRPFIRQMEEQLADLDRRERGGQFPEEP